MPDGRLDSCAGATRDIAPRISDSEIPLETLLPSPEANGMDTSHVMSSMATTWKTAPTMESTRCWERARMRSRSVVPSMPPMIWPTPTSRMTTPSPSRKRSAVCSVSSMTAGAATMPSTRPDTMPIKLKIELHAPCRQPLHHAASAPRTMTASTVRAAVTNNPSGQVVSWKNYIFSRLREDRSTDRRSWRFSRSQSSSHPACANKLDSSPPVNPQMR